MPGWRRGDLLVAYHENSDSGFVGYTIRIAIYDPTDWHLKSVIGPLSETTKYFLYMTAPSFLTSTRSHGTSGETDKLSYVTGAGVEHFVFEETFSASSPHYPKDMGNSWADAAGNIYYAYNDNSGSGSGWVLNKVDSVGHILRQWTWTTEDGEFRGDGFDGQCNILVVNRAGTVAYISNGGGFGDFPSFSPRNDYLHRLDLTTGAWLEKLNLPYITGDLPRPGTGFTLQVDSFNEDRDGNIWVASSYPNTPASPPLSSQSNHAISCIDPETATLIRKWSVPGILNSGNAPNTVYVTGDAAELDGIDINAAMDVIAFTGNGSVGNPVNTNFPVLIRRAEDGAFITNIPSLPGVAHTTAMPLAVCFARGNSPALATVLGGGQPMAQW